VSAIHTQAELQVLRELRDRFLANRAAEGGYWRSCEELALYDRTFAERIGWKWDAVLRELRARGWQPQSRAVLDWGCGSGVAGRRVLAAWPGQFGGLALHDVSPLAVEFAREAARAEFPGVHAVNLVHQMDAMDPMDFMDAEPALLLVSHVLNELSEPELDALLATVRRATEVIWVESGTHANSRRLVAEVRERLVGSGEFSIVAPCTHRQPCGMFAPGNDRHWCHSFAETPRAIFQDARWMHLGRELGIDLRATPYAFLVLERRAYPGDSDAARVIGRPRDYKGYSKILSCEAGGVHERMLQKRDAPGLLRAVQSEPGSTSSPQAAAPLFRWELAGGKIVGGAPAL
jgi:ribosomal protein RSM22 (predicted rRNA methylase)